MIVRQNAAKLLKKLNQKQPAEQNKILSALAKMQSREDAIAIKAMIESKPGAAEPSVEDPIAVKTEPS